jgi:hypothetical protein
MKTIMLIGLSIAFFAFSCERDRVPNEQCVSGKIVGQKCDVYALQLDQNILGATDWSKKNLTTGELEGTYSNVIGLINLPQEYRQDGNILFVTLRVPTKGESNVPCYADMPNPPSPYYVVLSVSKTKCNDIKE